MRRKGKDLVRQKWQTQKDNAKRRRIPFLLTFEQWLDIWQSSGHFLEMGKGSGKYCMARNGDIGPYAIGNVNIITHNENSSQIRHSDETKARIKAKMQARRLSPEHKRRIGLANMNHIVTEATRLKMSKSARTRALRYWSQRKEKENAEKI